MDHEKLETLPTLTNNKQRRRNEENDSNKTQITPPPYYNSMPNMTINVIFSRLNESFI
jgi:hypothetical protein